MASIGSVCIQRPIKLRSHGEGVIGKDSGCQHCLYTYLSVLTHTGLNMNTLEPFFFSCPSFLPCLFVFHRIYSTLSTSICHFLKCCHSFFSCLFAFASPANTICLFRSVSTCVLSLAFCFTCCVNVLLSVRCSIMLLPPLPLPPSLSTSLPRSELSNGSMK